MCKKTNFVLTTLIGVLVLLFAFTTCSNPTTSDTGKPAVDVNFIELSQNGSMLATTTAINLVFTEVIPGLSRDDITLRGVAGIVKGKLSGPGPEYLLPISGFTEGGTLSVSVYKKSYNIIDTPKSTEIYYVDPPVNVTFESVLQDGDEDINTTHIILSFSDAIAGLSSDDILLSGISGLEKGSLSGSGTDYILPISGFSSGGTLSVAISKGGYIIEASPKDVVIFYNEVQANIAFIDLTHNGSASATTTAITLTFSQAVNGLSEEDITLSGFNGIQKGSLSGAGPLYILPISGFSASGTLTVDVAKTGCNITDSPRTVDIIFVTTPENVTFSSVTQVGGSATASTVSLTLSFSQAINGLSAEDIILSGVGSITKGDLIRAGVSYTLPISGFSSGGTLSVAVNKAGYHISGSPKDVTIYHYTPPVAVAFSGVTQNGSASATTTSITLTFSVAINNLSENDITLGGVSGVQKGNLSGDGPAYVLPISGFSSGGTLSVSVAKSGYNISGSPKDVLIYYYAPPVSVSFSGVTQNGSPSSTTLELTLSFSQAISGLSSGDINLSGIDNVEKGTLTASGSTYTLPISGFSYGGNLTVAVTKAGYNISGSPKDVTIYHYTYVPPTSVSFNDLFQNGSSTVTTTALILTFSHSISGLTASHITLTGVDDVEKGSLSAPEGSGPYTYTLPISGFTEGGSLTVSLANPAGYTISGSPKDITIYYGIPPIEVSLSDIDQDGDSVTTTTELYLTFDEVIDDLGSGDISLGGVDDVEKGVLSGPDGSGPYTYTLPISGFTEGGTLSVAVTKAGYNISGSPMDVVIYHYTPPIDVTFGNIGANGDSYNSTTELYLTFDKVITGLEADNISISGASGLVAGTLSAPSGSGPYTYTLPISGFTATAGLGVTVSKAGYNIIHRSTPMSVRIIYITPVTFSALGANGDASTTTTELYLTFDKTITSLETSDITFSGVTGAAGILKTLLSGPSGSGPYVYTLTIDNVIAGGTLNVAVSKSLYNITSSSTPMSVEIFYFDPTINVTFSDLAENGGSSISRTKSLILTFSQAITDLDEEDIDITHSVSGQTISKGALSGPVGSGPVMYTLPIDGFTKDGTLSVSVAKENYNISSSPSPMTVAIKYAIPVTFLNTGSDGSNIDSTTYVALNFDNEIVGLSMSDINLTGTPAVIMDDLQTSDNKYFRLYISGFTSNGTVIVSVEKEGYEIYGSPKSTAVQYAAPVTFSSVTANGNETTTTTELILTFSQVISGLSESDITLGTLSGAAEITKILEGSGPSYTLKISNVTAGGSLRVRIAKSGYNISPQNINVTIFYMVPVTLNSVTRNGNATTTTTELYLNFSQAITGLDENDIKLSDAGIIKGTLTGSGPSYTLPISGFTKGGTITVEVTKTGHIITPTKDVDLFYVDIIPPRVTNGTISYNAGTRVVSWNKATDNVTPQNQLMYYFFSGTSQAALNTAVSSWNPVYSAKDINSYTLPINPPAGTFGTIVVEDEAGNRTRYNDYRF